MTQVLKKMEPPKMAVVRRSLAAKPFDEVKKKFLWKWSRIIYAFPDKKDEILSILNSENRPHTESIKPDYVEKVVSNYYGVPVEDFSNKSRRQELVFCRYTVFYVLKKYTKMSLKNIGLLYGRDHTTAIHGIQTCKDLIETSDVFRINIQNVEQLVLRGLQKMPPVETSSNPNNP